MSCLSSDKAQFYCNMKFHGRFIDGMGGVGGVCKMHMKLQFNPTSVWHKIRLSGRTDQPLCNHKPCHPLLAGLYSIPVTSGDCCILLLAFGICKSKLANLDKGCLPSITFNISCSHQHNSDPFRYHDMAPMFQIGSRVATFFRFVKCISK